MTLAGQLAETDGVRDAATVPPAAARPGWRHAHTLLAAPERSPELAHMDLKRLRAYRRTLLDEELRASYWRRLLQSRRDLLRAGSTAGDREALKEALTETRGPNARQVILTLHPEGGMPILPHLPDLWASAVDQPDEAAKAELFTRLATAENVLSSYREALHRRLDRATAELVARYHEEPALCLVALPLERRTRRP